MQENNRPGEVVMNLILPELIQNYAMMMISSLIFGFSTSYSPSLSVFCFLTPLHMSTGMSFYTSCFSSLSRVCRKLGSLSAPSVYEFKNWLKSFS